MQAFARTSRVALALAWLGFGAGCSVRPPDAPARSYSPWATALDGSGATQVCPRPCTLPTAQCQAAGTCPAGTLCEWIEEGSTTTAIRPPAFYGQCAVWPPGCTAGSICDCAPHFTRGAYDGGSLDVCYSCVESPTGGSMTTVYCNRLVGH